MKLNYALISKLFEKITQFDNDNINVRSQLEQQILNRKATDSELRFDKKIFNDNICP